MTETLASYGDNTRLSVRLGRALLPGEQRGKVYLLEPENIDDVCIKKSTRLIFFLLVISMCM